MLRLFLDICVPHDRSGGSVWEHGAVSGESQEVMLRADLTQIYIKEVRQIPESVKGKSDRQRQLRMGYVEPCDPADGIQQETVVFKEYQDSQVYDDCEYQIKLLSFLIVIEAFKLCSHIIVKNTGKQHEDHINRFPPCIKNKASQKKNKIAKLSRNQIIDQHKYRKKAENKKDAVKYHNSCSPIWLLYQGEESTAPAGSVGSAHIIYVVSFFAHKGIV